MQYTDGLLASFWLRCENQNSTKVCRVQIESGRQHLHLYNAGCSHSLSNTGIGKDTRYDQAISSLFFFAERWKWNDSTVLVYTNMLNFNLIIEFAEIGGIHAKVRGNVFVWYKLQQVAAALAKCFVSLFNRKRMQLDVAVDHSG